MLHSPVVTEIFFFFLPLPTMILLDQQARGQLLFF